MVFVARWQTSRQRRISVVEPNIVDIENDSHAKAQRRKAVTTDRNNDKNTGLLGSSAPLRELLPVAGLPGLDRRPPCKSGCRPTQRFPRPRLCGRAAANSADGAGRRFEEVSRRARLSHRTGGCRAAGGGPRGGGV